MSMVVTMATMASTAAMVAIAEVMMKGASGWIGSIPPTTNVFLFDQGKPGKPPSTCGGNSPPHQHSTIQTSSKCTSEVARLL